MGAWGAGLYSSDMAADMRAVIKSALRLPFDEDRIVDILRDCERGNRRRFRRRGSHHLLARARRPVREARRCARAGPREGNRHHRSWRRPRHDGKRGMKQADLRKRGARLAELRARLAAAPRASRPRATIKAPEPYVLEVGVLYACR